MPKQSGWYCCRFPWSAAGLAVPHLSCCMPHMPLLYSSAHKCGAHSPLLPSIIQDRPPRQLGQTLYLKAYSYDTAVTKTCVLWRGDKRKAFIRCNVHSEPAELRSAHALHCRCQKLLQHHQVIRLANSSHMLWLCNTGVGKSCIELWE